MSVYGVELIASIFFAVLVGFVVYESAEKHTARKLLNRHQAEWDAVRIRAMNEGASAGEIDVMYRDYCNELIAKYGYGRCYFPACWHENGR